MASYNRVLSAQLNKLDITIKRHLAEIGGPEVAQGLLDDAQLLAAMIRMNVPFRLPDTIGRARKLMRYHYGKQGYGPLRKAIVAKLFKRKFDGMPGAFVAIDRKMAFYAEMVEFGHKLIKKVAVENPGTRIISYFNSLLGRQVKRHQKNPHKIPVVIGHVPAHPFFRPAVRAFRRLSNTEAALKRIIERTKAA